MKIFKKKVGDTAEKENVFATTKIEREDFVFSWDLENFPEVKKNILSPTFVGGPNCGHHWAIRVRPNCEFQGSEYVGIFLKLVKSGNDAAVKADIQISLLDSQSKILKTKKCSGEEFLPGEAGRGSNFGPRQNILNPGFGFLTSGHILRIHFHVSTRLGWKHSVYDSSDEQQVVRSNGEASRAKIMKSFLVNEEFADVILQTPTQSFHASKIILATSPVFKAMFTSQWMESMDSIVKIEDSSDAAVKGMLEYLYTSKVSLCEENVEDLLAISDKYEIVGLKEECEEMLLRCLNIQNAVQILFMAHLHSPDNLKPKVILFINRFKAQVQKTEFFHLMKQVHPELFFDLYTALQP